MIEKLEEQLTPVINAWGTPTPFGVSRSSPEVAQAVASGLQRHVVIAELSRVVADRVKAVCKTESAIFCHCAAGALTLAAAGALTRDDAAAVATLPVSNDTRVIAIQEEHCVNYGQPVTQALRLSGSQVAILSGSAEHRIATMDELVRRGQLRAIVYVSSSLVLTPARLSRDQLFGYAKAANAWLIVDAAAQDWRLDQTDELSKADLTIFSLQKYLAGPTCGLLVGSSLAITAAQAHLAGIGRAMKPTKEALFGAWAALEQRDWLRLGAQRGENIERAQRFANAMGSLFAGRSTVSADDDHGPFPRLHLDFGVREAALAAADSLRDGYPRIAVGRSRIGDGIVTLELTHVDSKEEAILLAAVKRAMTSYGVRTAGRNPLS
ncbi:hypothetical protein CAL12_27720 [Bordetella genomosp. 8]|uniref:Aminotransferase class V domain-containing protein n=1 Tax=Bordetella genomosp. 8 TaxID=1416806 RepID=A0A1W6YUF1_9BORD|nr:hypothetical protein [Bordetella genomosp. 8]ARP84233.1 hypothetical protein CAL12_27720 [Bordetella genomosp. 8]